MALLPGSLAMTEMEAFEPVDAGAGEVERTFHFMLILHEHVVADRRGCFQVPAAREIVGVSGRPATIIDSPLWVRAQSPMGRRRPEPDCYINLIRRDAVLHPINQCLERFRAKQAAMPDARRTEQSVEMLYLLEVDIVAMPVEVEVVIVARRHLTVIVDHPAGHDKRIVRADIRDHLSAATPERVKIAERVGNVGDVA